MYAIAASFAFGPVAGSAFRAPSVIHSAPLGRWGLNLR